MYEDAKVAAAQAAAQAESAAAQAASGMSTVMASDPMQLAKTATERAAAAAERLNSGVTTEDLLGMRTPVKAAASASTTATPSANSDALAGRADGRLLNDAVARFLGEQPGRNSAAQLVALLEAARPADAESGAGAHAEAHVAELAAEREKVREDYPTPTPTPTPNPDPDPKQARAKMTAMAEQHAALQQVREPARAPPERRGSACLAASTCIYLPPHLPASTCLRATPRPAPRTQATKQKAVLKMREQKEALGARDAEIAQLREVQQGLREQLQQLQQQPAAHALPRQDPPRQGSRPPHNGPHHARREHHPEPPEESSRLPEGVSGLNIQLDGGSGTPIIEQLAEAIAADPNP